MKPINSLDDLFDLIEADLATTPENDRICHCGTCQDAVETSMKLMEQMVENDCILWAMQVASVMQVISLAMSSRAENSTDLYEAIKHRMTSTMVDKENNAKRLEKLLNSVRSKPKN